MREEYLRACIQLANTAIKKNAKGARQIHNLSGTVKKMDLCKKWSGGPNSKPVKIGWWCNPGCKRVPCILQVRIVLWRSGVRYMYTSVG